MSKQTEEGYHLREQRGQYKESSICFVCLKIIPSPRPGCDGDKIPMEEVINKKAFRTLFRYLSVDGSDVFQKPDSKSGGKEEDNKEEEEAVETKTDEPLLLCEGCSRVTGELMNLIEKLELTKIWINHWLRQLVDILSRSSIGPKRMKRSRLDDSMTSLLRAHTKKKCISKLRETDFPRVHLERNDGNSNSFIDVENGKVRAIRFLIPSELIKEECEDQQNKDDNLNEDMKQIQANEISHDIDLGPVAAHHVHVKEEAPTARSNLKVIMLCPYCDETLSSNSGLNRHTAAFHPEQFLSSAKASDLSEDNFKSVCQNLLSKLCQVKIIDKKQRGCPYCRVTSGNRVYLKAHLIHGHRDVLLRKLELLQKGIEETDDIGTAASFQLKSSIPQRPRNFYCRHCPKTCITQWSLKRHILLMHRLSSSALPAMAMKSPRKHTCDHCGEKVRIGYLETHEKQCLASLTELETPTLPPPNSELRAPKDDIPLDEVAWQCTECERSFATLDQLDTHQNLQNCSKMPDSSEASTSFKCSECEANFWHLPSLYRHRKTCHPNSDSRGNHPAYYAELKVKSSSFKCLLCGRSFNREYFLKRHLETVCKSVPNYREKRHPPLILTGSQESSSTSFSRTQGDSVDFIKMEPIVLSRNDSLDDYHNGDNDYDGDSSNSNMMPDYDPLM